MTNALLHKDYASGVPVRITVSPQRLVIQNVGAVPTGWTEEDFVREHAPHFRNPVLATAARLLEITPGWGEGVRTMREGCIQAGAELPNFDLSPEHTAVVFPLPATKRGAAAVRAKAGGKTRAEGGRDRKATAPQATGDGARRATFAERSLAAAHKLDMTQTDEYVLQVLTTNGRAGRAHRAGARGERAHGETVLQEAARLRVHRAHRVRQGRLLERHRVAGKRKGAVKAPDGLGGGKGARTPGLRLAKPALSQLSYTPVFETRVSKPDKSAPAIFVWCAFASKYQ